MAFGLAICVAIGLLATDLWLPAIGLGLAVASLASTVGRQVADDRRAGRSSSLWPSKDPGDYEK